MPAFQDSKKKKSRGRTHMKTWKPVILLLIFFQGWQFVCFFSVLFIRGINNLVTFVSENIYDILNLVCLRIIVFFQVAGMEMLNHSMHCLIYTHTLLTGDNHFSGALFVNLKLFIYFFSFQSSEMTIQWYLCIQMPPLNKFFEQTQPN